MKIVLNKFLLGFLFYSVLNAQTVNGNFQIIENNNSVFTVKLQISIQQGEVAMGNAVIRFNFNTNSISFPQNPVDNIDYIIHNLNHNDYYSSVSLSAPGTISINIAQATKNSLNITTNYIDIATIYFKVKNSTDSANIQPELQQFFSPYSSKEWALGSWNVISALTGINKIIPEKFELAQNYPNPFNPSTTIRYSIPTSNKVIMRLYDALGKEITTLVNDLKGPGIYQVRLNDGNLPSGIYFYRIEAGNFIETKKMMLIK
ncbi:MAG: T9SS type A sorting domain-containing protein [Bacteroidetes bacterium]|nr:T9SS type A sorting domain-containing protein [Bacteroidota bacterium]